MSANNGKMDKVDKLVTALDALANFQDVLDGYTQCVTKVNVTTVSRLILLIVAWINQILAMFGVYQIPTLSEAETCIIASGITVAITAVSYWRNNSWSGDATVCDAILRILRASEIDSDEVLDALKTVVDKTNDKVVLDLDEYRYIKDE